MARRRVDPETAIGYKNYILAVGRAPFHHAWSDGTYMFYEPEKDAVVSYNPNAAYNGETIFVPTDPVSGEKTGQRYYLRGSQRYRPPIY